MNSRRSGFTLVEMLVAVGLTMVMMTLFATIFQFATAGMSIQKGVAENDQRNRLVLTLLRSDLTNRTFKNVLPFNVGETDDTDRKGYFYIGENDPDDDTDDVLQLTVSVPVGDDEFYGKAAFLLTGSTMATDPNQPEFDDGYVTTNQTAASQTAEVCYFLRHGTLYRRVLLLRDPSVTVDPTNARPYNPKVGTTQTDATMADYQTGAAGVRNFYTDLDFSAHYTAAIPVFHGVNDLGITGTFPISKPHFRFGFDLANGLPREFTTTSTVAPLGPRFFGRYTQEETSFLKTPVANPVVSFGYPGRQDAAGPPGTAGSESPNPYDATGVPITLNDTTGKIVEYSGGTRLGEDILLTGVLSFDVKVWDDGASLGPDLAPGLAGIDDNPLAGNGSDDATEIGWHGSDDGAFVDVGHAGFQNATFTTDTSFYSAAKLANLIYCPVHPVKSVAPSATRLYRFDTWHPQLDLANPAVAGTDPAPYRAADPLSPPIGQPMTRPLRSIQIKIKFFDQTSQQVRDTTLVFSLR